MQPEEAEEVEEPEVEETEESEAPEPSEDTFDGGQFNPDELPEELRPAWRQLQGAFTKKTQDMAGTLKQAEALLALDVDVETAANAVNLYSQINDPQNWPALYEQLGQVMEQNGIEVPGARAATRVESPATSGLGDADLDKLVEDDPDLAPLVATVRAQRAELQRVDALQARLDAADAERMAAREEAQEAHLLQVEMDRIAAEESQIREAFKHYGDPDVHMIHKMSSFHNGDLLTAQAELEEYVQGRIDRALSAKGRPKKAASAPVSTAKAPAPAAEETLEDITVELEEKLRAMQRAGTLEIG